MSCIAIIIVLFASFLSDTRVAAYTRRSTESPLALADSTLTINGIPFLSRAHWMRQANRVLDTSCPFGAFGSVIVNHTDTIGLGELICTGVNTFGKTGNPINHGEIVAISNCTDILTDPNGPYKFHPSDLAHVFSGLSLYTNAESCPMCASAIRWAGFKEYIYGTSIDTLIEKGWGQIRISSLEVFKQSFDLSISTTLIAGVLENETNPLFSWQFDAAHPCPKGCAKEGNSGGCTPETLLS